LTIQTRCQGGKTARPAWAHDYLTTATPDPITELELQTLSDVLVAPPDLVRFDFLVQLLMRIPDPETLSVADFFIRIAFSDSPVAGAAIQALHHIFNLDSFSASLFLTLHPLSSGRLKFGEREVLNRDLPALRLRICG
jgi:hypothetical protein